MTNKRTIVKDCSKCGRQFVDDEKARPDFYEICPGCGGYFGVMLKPGKPDNFLKRMLRGFFR